MVFKNFFIANATNLAKTEGARKIRKISLELIS
jgi:hypothetical protein